jgi:hypothetical protein
MPNKTYRNFFYRYSNAGKPNPPIEMSSKDKEHLVKVRQNILAALQGEEPTKEQERNQAALSSVSNLGSVSGFTQMASVFSNYIYSAERDKRGKIETYREMAKYPRLAFAVQEYVNEAINEDKEGRICELVIKNKGISENVNQRKTLLAEFDHVVYDIMKADENGDRWFREFLIDGELAFEKVFDNADETKGLIQVRKLMTTRLHPIWEDLESDKILFFAYQGESNDLINFHSEQIAYANSGLYDWARDESMKIVLSFLEPAKTTYKRLKLLEDALVIYRIVRAPERRVFKIDVGALPPTRADQFMDETIRRYRQRKYFNPATGDVDSGLDMMAMTEDFWFPVFQGGRSSDVTSLPGGQGLGEIGDVDYFKDLMFQGLGIPKRRYGEEARFSIGNNDDITSDEVNFMKLVKKYSKRFSKVFHSTFLTHLKLKGIAQEFGISDQDIQVQMFTNNLFDRYMEAKVLELQFEKFGHFADLIDLEKPLFSRKWVAMKYLEISEEEWNENQELLVSEEPEEDTGEEADATEEDTMEDFGL